MIRFDEVLPIVAKHLKRWHFNASIIPTVVRDPSGLITIVLPNEALHSSEWDSRAQSLHEELGAYSPGPTRVLLRVSDLIEPDDILASDERFLVDGLEGTADLWLVDRLLSNQDWVKRPRLSVPPIPTGVGFSIKGGVGRSTAMTVLAWYLAQTGKRVLLVDLDLEAPGLAPMLLPELPDFGVLDWCVESLVEQANPQLFEQMLAPAPLGQDSDGSILVVPAYGRKTQDYVAKLGRAYIPNVSREGRTRGLADRINSLIHCAATRLEPPDVVLIDARAGLHDIGSAAVTQLGAQVFMFARDDPQSWDAYRQLFLHFKNSQGIEWGMPDNDLRWRLKMVAAQSEATQSASNGFLAQSYSLWTDLLYDAEDGETGSGSVPFILDDEAAPHRPLRILYDTTVRSLNFVDPEKRPDWAYLETVFESFIGGAEDRLVGDMS